MGNPDFLGVAIDAVKEMKKNWPHMHPRLRTLVMRADDNLFLYSSRITELEKEVLRLMKRERKICSANIRITELEDEVRWLGNPWISVEDELPPTDTIIQVSDGETVHIALLSMMGWTYIAANNKFYFAFARDFAVKKWAYLLPSPTQEPGDTEK